MENEIDDFVEDEVYDGPTFHGDEVYEETGEEPDEQEGDQEEYEEEDEGDFIARFLRQRGILDKTKIKFEDDEGYVSETDWDTLSDAEKFNLITSSESQPERDLEDTEIQLINAIRQSGMTPMEYLQYVQQDGINRYMSNSQPNYTVDQYSDDELFVMDLLNRTKDITDEEAVQALEQAKANEALYAKQVEAIRNEYRGLEQDSINQAQQEQANYAQQQYANFSRSVADSISNFTDFYGCDLDLDQQAMNELYDLITGYDAAGNSHFSKVLNNPEVLVRLAYVALHGRDMIDDINTYWQSEI